MLIETIITLRKDGTVKADVCGKKYVFAPDDEGRVVCEVDDEHAAQLLASGNFCLGQTEEDINGFLLTGQECYNRGDLTAAALEFENILLIDRQNFGARVWLAQVYIDLKDFDKARKLLTEASLQAPDHPRVIQLQKILGAGKPGGTKIRAADPVVREALTLIGSSG